MGINSCGTTLIDEGLFKNIGAITWDTTAKTAGFTAVAGNGYFVNTTSGAITVTLPATPTAGDVVGIADYANTADTNNITIGRNGSNIQGQAIDFDINVEGTSILLVYVDATQGWLSIDAAQASDIQGPAFVAATGGTVTCCGDYKIHTFTGPGTFTITCAGNPDGSDTVDYLVVAGGGGGGSDAGGGGGAGGYRESSGAASGCYSRSPLGACVSALPVSVTGYPITVGGGGGSNTKGNPSIFSSITSAGGGTGNGPPGCAPTLFPGGSGGGGRFSIPSGTGNSPPVSPPQGNPGGNSAPPFGFFGGGGGGGSTAAGSPGGSPSSAGPGGAGATSSINATPTARAGGGGGGGGVNNPIGGTGAAGGGNGQNKCAGDGFAATTNSGSGGGAGGEGAAPKNGGNGGSGIVIIRYKYQ